MNLDNIKLDDIWNGFKNQTKNIDNIDKKIREKYPVELDKYDLITNASQLSHGDCIRYTKKNTLTLSCVSIIKLIKYTDKYVDYICLTTTHDKMWKIYVSNHYIFRLNKLSIGKSLREKLNQYVTTKHISIPAKEISKMFDSKYSKLDNNINNILKSVSIKI